MIYNWTFFDFTIQWIWVGIIVVLAVVYLIGALRKSMKKSRKRDNINCAGCILADKCDKPTGNRSANGCECN